MISPNDEKKRWCTVFERKTASRQLGGGFQFTHAAEKAEFSSVNQDENKSVGIRKGVNIFYVSAQLMTLETDFFRLRYGKRHGSTGWRNPASFLTREAEKQ